MNITIDGEQITILPVFSADDATRLRLNRKLITDPLPDEMQYFIDIARRPMDWLKMIVRGRQKYWFTFMLFIEEDGQRVFAAEVKTRKEKPYTYVDTDMAYEVGVQIDGNHDIIVNE